MARPVPTGSKAKTDWYEELTNRIISVLEELALNPKAWSKPWKGLSGMPRNGLTGRHYNGFNVWLLALVGRGDPRWYTFNQAKEATGYKRNPDWKGRSDTYRGVKKWVWTGEGEDPGHGVRKGEHGTHVFYWHFVKKYEDRDTGREIRKPSQSQIVSGKAKLARTIPVIKVYTVFNATQIDGLPTLDIPDIDPGEKYAQAQALVEILSVDVRHHAGSDVAGYSPKTDDIQLPAPGQFKDIEHYWATALHEVVHWTGHGSRLDRDLSVRFGSDAYAFEELVAEIGSAFLCAHLGIEGELQHPQYIAHWLKRLREDKYAVFKASSLAQQAMDFILAGGVLDEEDEKTSDIDPDQEGTVGREAA